MRLRALAKLEEIEIRKEHDGLSAEKAQIETLLGSDAQQWKVLAKDICRDRQDLRSRYGAGQAPHAPSPTRRRMT